MGQLPALSLSSSEMLASAFGAAGVPCIGMTVKALFAPPPCVTAPVRNPPPNAATASAAASSSTAARRRRGRKRTVPPTLGAIARRRAPDRGERLLHGLLCAAAVAEPAQREPEHRARVAAVEDLER